MLEVKFYDSVPDDFLKVAAIVTKHNNQCVLGRAKGRDTYEIPAGHREAGESILDAAKRELYEETGATDFDIEEVCAYSVQGIDHLIQNTDKKFGMLYFATIHTFGDLPNFEIEEVTLFDHIPDQCTYPLVQPKLVERVLQYLQSKN